MLIDSSFAALYALRSSDAHVGNDVAPSEAPKLLGEDDPPSTRRGVARAPSYADCVAELAKD